MKYLIQAIICQANRVEIKRKMFKRLDRAQIGQRGKHDQKAHEAYFKNVTVQQRTRAIIEELTLSLGRIRERE
jgi:hypothetical protein